MPSLRGTWVSNTRKLNGHWQSNKRKGFLNMIKELSKMSFKTNKSDSLLSLMLDEDKQGDNIMYIQKKQGIFITKHMEGSLPKSIIKYSAEPENMIFGTGDEYMNFWDNNQKLSPNNKRFFGLQISFIIYDGGYFEPYGNGGDDTPSPNGNALPINTTGSTGDENSKLFITDENSKFGKFRNSDFSSLISDIVKQHNTTQSSNTEYKGDNTAPFYLDESIVKGNFIYGDGGQSIFSLSMSDSVFKKTGRHPNQGSQMPLIGKTVFTRSAAADGAEKEINLMYVITPTVYDEKGQIAVLKDE